MLFSLLISSFIAGSIGTAFGCYLAILIKEKGKANFLYGFTAGFLIVIVMFDLVPSSIVYSNYYISTLSILLGAAFVSVLNRILNSGIGEKHRNMGVLLFIAITLHNFPEGVAVGAGFEIEMGFAIFIAVIMAIHNVPEGMAMGVSLISENKTKTQIIMFGIVAGLPTCVGAVAGNLFAKISQVFVGAGLGFASGAMIYVCLSELVPCGKKANVNLFYVYLAVGAAFGQIILILFKNLI